MSTRVAVLAQLSLVAVIGVLAFLPRATESVGAAQQAQATPAPAVAQAAPQEANLALSTIEVVVSRNDTMDRLFRRFELNLADLATLRGLPELREQFDRLKPGELLRFMHRG